MKCTLICLATKVTVEGAIFFFTVRRGDMWEGVGVSLRNIHFLNNR